MADHIVKLKDGELPRLDDVEVTVVSGLHKGTRYSVRPKNHVTCHGTGRVVRIVQSGKRTEGVPGVCDCIIRPVTKEVGQGVQLDAKWLTPEQRAKARRDRLKAELEAAKQDLTELLARRDTVVEQCRTGAAESRGRIDVLAQEEQAMREVLAEQKDTETAAEQRLADARKALEVAEHAAKHARLEAERTETKLGMVEKARAAAQDTATKLEREAERVSVRPDLLSRIEGARRAVDRVEAEMAKAVEGAKLTPGATTVGSESASEAA